MKMRKYSFSIRLIAMVLSLVLIVSVMPAIGLVAKASAAGIAGGILTTEADNSTLDLWKDAFDPTNISTEHAGGVWTDKTVITADQVSSVMGNIAGLEIDENNFLVALSALAANSVVIGKDTVPTDTIFVLDMSASMSSTEKNAVVAAANDAIHTLLTSNSGSRIGVVMYSADAQVLLPLDRYTPVTDGDTVEYIEISNGQIRTARVASGNGNFQQNYTYVTNSAGENVNVSINLSSGTYIQGGLFKALELFDAVTVSDTRTPVVVLMSDGAPTRATDKYNDVPDQYTYITSGAASGFLTGLTAAYVMRQIEAKYNTNGFMYTLGLGLGNDNIAKAVMDPTDSGYSEIQTMWDEFYAAASKTDKSMTLSVGNNSVTIPYTDGLNELYVDKFFSASQASDLSTEFKSIVNEISLQSGYYVTRLDGIDANSGGYITFVDEIGTGMQVKDIEGILIGSTLYTGEMMAQSLYNGAFGTEEAPTILGDNMVWALIQRLRITATGEMTAEEIARDLLHKAYAAGQLSYNAATGAWSNYIGWFSDTNGNYVGFWDAEDPDAVIPEGAVYANKCYGMLGATTQSQTAHTSDLMYVAVQVSKPVTTVNGERTILVNSPERVTFSIPASLIPVVTYQIAVDADSGTNIDENTEATIAYNGADPIRLIYEVGVHSELTPENIHSFVRTGYQAKDDNGNYYLYTNAWYWEGADDHDWQDESTHPDADDEILQNTGKNAITYAYFEPGVDNEHYYFTEDALVYVKSGNSYVPYEGTVQPSGTYYFKHLVYTGAADTSDASKAVTATVTAHYEELSSAALLLTKQTAGESTWYVPAGTMHRNMHDHSLSKVEAFGENGNITGSFFAIREQLVDIAVDDDTSHHYEIVYMGNNGRVTYMPSQGFSLTKEVNDSEIADNTYNFTVTISGDTDGKVTLVRGTESQEYALENGVLELTLSVSETVYVTGLDTGAVYTIQEVMDEGFKLNAIAAEDSAQVDLKNQSVKDVVVSNSIQAVTFVNGIQYYGSLRVGKEVTYLKNSRPASVNTDTFAVKVTFVGLGGKDIYVDGVKTTLDAEGTYSFSIADGKAVLFSGIPENTVYDVTEVSVPGTVIPEGYTADDGYTITIGKQGGSIAANDTGSVVLKNQYEPRDLVFDDGEPKITVEVNKTLVGDLTDWSFDFVLRYYNGSAWEDVKVNGETVKASVDETNRSVTFDLEGVAISSAGDHYFRVAELIPEEQILGMTYDRTFHDFVVTVVDDLSGELKIQNVESIQHATVNEPIDANNDGAAELWTVTTDFTNKYSVESTKLTIQANKSLYNITAGEEVPMVMKDGQFKFVLYSADEKFENLVQLEESQNGVAGQIVFAPIFYEPGTAVNQNYYYVVKESNSVSAGYTVDDAVYKITVTVSTVNTEDGAIAQIAKVTVQKNDEEASDVTEAVLANDNVLNGNSITFKNTYKATPAQVTITGTKTLTNLTPGVAGTKMSFNSDVFSFQLTKPDDSTELCSNTSEGTFGFNTLVFYEAGVYTYTVRELSVSMAGVSKDATVHTIVVTVTDDGAGTLNASVTLNGDPVTGHRVVVAFNNTYKAEPVTNIVLSGIKQLQVSDKFNRFLRSGEFRFTLTKPDGSTETVFNDANGNFAFSKLAFDTVGAYTYTISEVYGGATVNGVAYDPKTITITIDVVDGGNGKLVAKIDDTEITEYNVGTFINTYTASPVVLELTAHKYLLGDRDLKENEFSFTLTKPDGSTETVKNDADGLVQFGSITFDGVGTHIYKIVEDKLDENGDPLTAGADGTVVYKGVTYSLLEYTVTVNIIDNGSGNLVAHITTVDNNGDEYPVQFYNRYDAEPVTVNLTGSDDKDGEKTLTDASSATNKTLDDFEFKFVLTDASGNVIETVSDNGSGFNFTDITYDEPTEKVYYIYELDENVPGVFYDATKYKVTVKVTDNLEGNLVADVSYEKITTDENGDETFSNADAIAFSNTYQASETSVTFSGIKTLKGGRKLLAGEFSFTLTKPDGSTETVTNDEYGVFTFSIITFDQEGTYVYTLEEADGEDDNVTYDGTKYTLTVTVTDVNGELKATTAITAGENPVDEYGFTNIFTPDNVKTLIGIEKILDNRTDVEMGPGGFLFDLYCNETGKTVTVTSDENGLAQIELTFTAEDVGKNYTYKLTEQKGDNKYMTYSQASYAISIAVNQDQTTGELSVTVTRNGETITENAKFVNIYQLPSIPETGDNANVELFTILMGISVVCLLAVLVLNKKFLR